jgi:hypothetical protein
MEMRFGGGASAVTVLRRELPAGGPDEGATITNDAVLRRPCALGMLQMIYSALAAATEEPEGLTIRADLYGRLFRRALRNTTLELDTNGDGEADMQRPLNVLQLSRD